MLSCLCREPLSQLFPFTNLYDTGLNLFVRKDGAELGGFMFYIMPILFWFEKTVFILTVVVLHRNMKIPISTTLFGW